MTSHPPFQLSVVFASLIGAAGFVLATQAYVKFRGTPFGRVLAILPPIMAIIALYHPILIVYPRHAATALLIESGGFALLVVFAALAVRTHRRMSARGAG